MRGKWAWKLLAATAATVFISISPGIGWSRPSDPAGEAEWFIQRFDSDGDGQVTADEFPGDPDRFDDLDINGDGVLDGTELSRRPPQGPPDADALLARFDADGDGVLSSAEFPGPADRFKQLDADGDGFLSAGELNAADAGPGPRHNGGFENDDVDQDGRVSREEFNGPADLFDRLDTDGDGYITREAARPKHALPSPDKDTAVESTSE